VGVGLVARPAPGVELEDLGDEVLAYDGATLTLLSGAEVAVVRAADGVSDVLDLPVARDLEDRGVLTLTEPPPGERFRRPGHVGYCEDGDHVVLMDLRSGFQHVLSESATQVWLLVTETGSLDQAIAELQAAHPEATGITDDVARFVDGLIATKLLERLSLEG
jgi:hypothetical protein